MVDDEELESPTFRTSKLGGDYKIGYNQYCYDV